MKRSVAACTLIAMLLGLRGCAPRGLLGGGNAPPDLDLPARFTALGTEPFWAAKVDGTALLYQTPEDQGGKRASLTRRALPGSMELTGSLSGNPVKLKIARGPCSDGMSDTIYPFSAEMRIGTDVLQGCAKAS